LRARNEEIETRLSVSGNQDSPFSLALGDSSSANHRLFYLNQVLRKVAVDRKALFNFWTTVISDRGKERGFEVASLIKNLSISGSSKASHEVVAHKS